MTTEPAGPIVDPGSVPTRGTAGVVAPVLWQLLVDQGVAPNVAHCAVVTSYSIVDEATLLAMGLVEGNEEALDVLREGSLACGVTEEQVEAAIAAQFG